MDHLLTPYLFVDKYKDNSGELGYSILYLGKFFACFLLVKFVLVVVIVLRGPETREDSGSTLRLLRTKLGPTYHLFLFLIQTPMYDSEENKNNNTANSFLQNAISDETLTAPTFTKKF